MSPASVVTAAAATAGMAVFTPPTPPPPPPPPEEPEPMAAAAEIEPVDNVLSGNSRARRTGRLEKSDNNVV